MTDEIETPKITCTIFMSDKVTLCGKEATDVIISPASPPCMLPVCEEHNKRLDDGESFLLKERDGERIFAIVFDLKKEDDKATIDVPHQSPSLDAETPSA